MDGQSPSRVIDSAEQITALIHELIRALPSLDQVTVEVVRLPVPDADGCNWMAKHSELPPHLPAGHARILSDVIANARANFNLWDVH